MRKIGLFLIFFVLGIYNIAFAAFPTYNLTKLESSVDREIILNEVIRNFNVRTTGNSTWQAKYDSLYNQIVRSNSFSFGIINNTNASTNYQITYDIKTNGITISSVPTNKNSYFYKNSSQDSKFYLNNDDFYLNQTIYNTRNAFYNYSSADMIYQLLLDQEGNYWEYSSTDFSIADVKPPFTFEPWYDLTTTQYYNVLTYVVKRSYSVNNWSLGYVTDYGNYDYYKFDLIDSAYDPESPLYYVTIDKNRNVINRNQLIFTGDSVYVPSRLMQFNYQYKLNIYLYTADAVVDTKTFYIRFIPVDSQIIIDSGDSSGVISGTVDYSPSGDFNTQDSTNNIMDSSQVDNIINEYLSGDVEDLSNEFGYTALDNPFTTFLFHILESIYDALTLRESVVLTATYNGMTFTLNSDDFITPESPIKTFIRSLLIFLYIYGNYKYFHYLITLVETAKIDKVVNEIGTDEFHDSNIM